MSEPKPPVTPPALLLKLETVAAASKSLPKPGYTNPAFQMMGIPRLRLPSRNWMIFWSVLAVFGGGAAYDKYEQRQLRKTYMEKVAKYGQEPMEINLLPRKLTIFIAPPPSDYLDESLKLFRKYVKPILNSAAIDFDIVSEQRQGEIRYRVAEDIRNLRRKYKDEVITKEEPIEEPSEFIKPTSVFHWSDNTKSGLRTVVRNEDGTTVDTKLSTSLSPLSLLGINYQSNLTKDIPNLQSEDTLTETPSQAGGVICIGRGAYKEYLTGLHEGLLGPLQAPVVEEEEKIEKLVEEDTAEKAEDEKKEEEARKIPLPYITPTDYSKAELAPELDLSRQLFYKENQPAYFQQPIVVLRSFNLVGFLRIPERIFRFYQKRTQLDYYHSQAMSVVEKNIKPFDKTRDLELAKDEEKDWPSKWVKQGKEKGSLWTSELSCDDRVVENLYVYNNDE